MDLKLQIKEWFHMLDKEERESLLLELAEPTVTKKVIIGSEVTKLALGLYEKRPEDPKVLPNHFYEVLKYTDEENPSVSGQEEVLRATNLPIIRSRSTTQEQSSTITIVVRPIFTESALPVESNSSSPQPLLSVDDQEEVASDPRWDPW